MNYIAFQKKILSMVNSPLKLKKFDWAYDDGYVYITITGCEIYRIPYINMYLNLGAIKIENHCLCELFNKCVNKATELLTMSECSNIDYNGRIKLIQCFEDSDLWLDYDRLTEFGTYKELYNSVHFMSVLDGEGICLKNEADEPIGILLGVRRRKQ